MKIFTNNVKSQIYRLKIIVDAVGLYYAIITSNIDSIKASILLKSKL